MEGDETCGFYDDYGYWIYYDTPDGDFEEYSMEDWIADNCSDATDPMCDAMMNFPVW